MLGALIAGGASLLGGLFGRNDAKKRQKKEEEAIRAANEKAQELAAQMNKEVRARADAAALVPVATERESSSVNTSSTRGGVDMAAFMAAAEENGFNPLTFLRSGALSLFAKQDSVSTMDSWDWQCTTGERAMDAALAGQYIPQLSPVIGQTQVPGMGEIFGNALTSGASQYLADQNQARQNAFQKELLGQQLAGANRNGGLLSRSFYTPSGFLSGGDRTTAGNAALSSAFKNPGDPLMMAGNRWNTDPLSSNCDAYETRYGDSELLTTLCGLGVGAADLAKNWPSPTWEQLVPKGPTVGEVGQGIADYWNSIAASPSNPGKTWRELFSW